MDLIEFENLNITYMDERLIPEIHDDGSFVIPEEFFKIIRDRYNSHLKEFRSRMIKLISPERFNIDEDWRKTYNRMVLLIYRYVETPDVMLNNVNIQWLIMNGICGYYDRKLKIENPRKLWSFTVEWINENVRDNDACMMEKTLGKIGEYYKWKIKDICNGDDGPGEIGCGEFLI